MKSLLKIKQIRNDILEDEYTRIIDLEKTKEFLSFKYKDKNKDLVEVKYTFDENSINIKKIGNFNYEYKHIKNKKTEMVISINGLEKLVVLVNNKNIKYEDNKIFLTYSIENDIINIIYDIRGE